MNDYYGGLSMKHVNDKGAAMRVVHTADAARYPPRLLWYQFIELGVAPGLVAQGRGSNLSNLSGLAGAQSLERPVLVVSLTNEAEQLFSSSKHYSLVSVGCYLRLNRTFHEHLDSSMLRMSIAMIVIATTLADPVPCTGWHVFMNNGHCYRV
ncbi:hypothetical protein Y032_0212g2240 [Ancylostoma ceylanicum]|nr:hypothetical protein Y032_0212g2240 [Ancylostoma ceylanicum]